MKVAIIQSFLPSRSQGGVGHFAHQLANRLVAGGHRVTVFSLDPAPTDAAYSVVAPKPGRRLVAGRLGRLYGFGLWLAQQDYSPFDVVHAMGDNQLIRTRVPVIRTISGAALAEAAHARKLRTRFMYLSIYLLELLAVARADAAVGISRSSNAFFPGVRTVIPNGVNLGVFRCSGRKSEVPSILFVGHRLRDRKRADLLLEVFQRIIRPALPEAQLWMVCDDVVREPGVHCWSNLPVQSLADLYRRAWVFCLPSSYEGFGRPYAEAMASGTPVVATRNPGALEVLERGRYGIITSAIELGDELLALLGDSGRRQALAQAGLRRARDFDWGTVVGQYETLYRDTVQRRAARKCATR